MSFELETYLGFGAVSDASRTYQHVGSLLYEHEGGTPATAQDVTASVERVVASDPSIVSPNLNYLGTHIHMVLDPLYPPGASDLQIRQAYRALNDETIQSKTDMLMGQVQLEFTDKLLAIVCVSTPVDPRTTLSSVVEEIASKMPDRESIAQAGRKRSSPSSGATVSERMKTQQSDRKDAVYNNRPLCLAPPPVGIYHPAFARFARSMTQPLDPTSAYTTKELCLARKFIDQSAKYYAHEKYREAAIAGALSDAVARGILDGIPLAYSRGSHIPAGVIRSDTLCEGFAPVAAIVELKNEIGIGGCDPLAQAECAYVTVYTSPEAKPVRSVCCCPALLIAIAGPYIAVSGAVFADQLIAQPLTDYISVIPQSAHKFSAMSEAMLRVARLFRALKQCIADLKTYYCDLQDAQLRSAQRAPLLAPPRYIGPSFGAYTNCDAQQVELKYLVRLAPQYSSKTIFLADAYATDTDEAPSRVVVKFTEAYGDAAHKLAHERGFAPDLRFCEKVDSVGMWVVVMDYVASDDTPIPLPSVAAESLRNAVKTLHNEGFVFGDLREPNVLVTKEGQVQLIDFDWCGRVEEARYPYDIAMTSEHGWHADVRPGGLITKEHDAYMFEQLTGEKL